MSRMKKAILSVLLVVAGYSFWRWEFGVQITDKEVTRLIQTHIPIGSDKQEVIRFLDAQGWDHTEDRVLYPDRQRDPNDIQYKAAGVIFGGLRNIGRILTYGKIGLVFVFDRQGKLMRYRVQQSLEAV